jgi:predicted HTH transcriptional regulator
MTRFEILQLLTSPEGPLVERKSKGIKPNEIRQSVVAFANSLNAGEEAVIFVGVRNDGEVQGLSDAEADARQKDIREACERECYPPVKYRIELLQEHKNVLAIIIPASEKRPHFAGPAYIRRGSESVAASQEMLQELIDSRTSKVAELLRYKRELTVVTVLAIGHRMFSDQRTSNQKYRENGECHVVDCNSHFVRLARLHDGLRISRALERVQVSYDEVKWRPMLIFST